MYFIIPDTITTGVFNQHIFTPSVSLLHFLVGVLINKIGTFEAAFLMNEILSFLIIAVIFLSVFNLTKSKIIAFLSAFIITIDPLFMYIAEGIEYNFGSIFFLLLMILFTTEYINAKEGSIIKLIPAVLSLLLAQAGRPEFQFISPIIFILLFVLYENKNYNKKTKYIIIFSIFISALYCTNMYQYNKPFYD